MDAVREHKTFFQVFTSLRVEEDLEVLFREVEVKKVTTNTTRDSLRVHILSKHLIQKEHIWEMEEQIKEQLFEREQIDIGIIEQYQLSGQYTPSILLKEYRNSIHQEIEKQSVVLANLFAGAVIQHQEEEQVLEVKLIDSVLSHGKGPLLRETLEEVLIRRFQLSLKLQIYYDQEQKISNREEKEKAIQQEVNAILQKEEIDEISLHLDGQLNEAKEKAKKQPAQKKKVVPHRRLQRPMKQGDQPDLVYGRYFDEEPILLEQVVDAMGEIVILGQVIKVDTREIRHEKTILTFAITDFTDTISVKMFARNEQVPTLLGEIEKGAFLKVKGVTTVDSYEGEVTMGSVTGVKRSSDFREQRKDESEIKRVELHCHTKMSDMDAVADALSLVEQAHKWGHPAIAITDHGVVHAFPEANQYVSRLPKDDPFKVIYGVEGYVVDDLTEIVKGISAKDNVAILSADETLDDTFVILDLETTGFSPISDRIIEIGAIKVTGGEIVDTFSTFVNPKRPIPFKITELTGIADEMVMDAPTIEEVLPKLLSFVSGAVLVAHNADFDLRFIQQNCRYQEIEAEFVSIDTVVLARILLPSLSRYRLDTVAKALEIPLENHHRAVDDAKATTRIFLKFVEMLKQRGVTTLEELNRFGVPSPDAIRKLPNYHIILLAKNEIGKLNLYQLISKSHLTYFGRRPRIPRSEIMKHREGLVVGAACESGEIYQAILGERPAEELAKLAEFYDYYEIQPLGNNQFMIANEKLERIQSEQDLISINEKIVALGEQFEKPVVATGDVHFLNPEDEIYRRIIMAGKGFSDADKQPPLYLRTTEEMLAEFSYLGSRKAREVVIDNPRKIAESIEKISPVKEGKYPPVLQGSEEELREICYQRAHEIYGRDLPATVANRLEKELKSIISNGYATMYMAAQKLVGKSLAEGYLVGSRGSVGSSFAATMAGITEVNPLSPHYYCASCFYSDFDSPDVLAYAGSCGYDMPEKNCPNCQAVLKKEGFDIPFETFLGFEGDKEPDIDLNFSGDYQAKAHKHTEDLFGKGCTYRVGTISALADKTAYGFVKHYFEERGKRKRRPEILRIADQCIGIRRSTGQHPGGIIVLPPGFDINEFTPVQRPANDITSDTVTTHFEYESIEHNLLKLDILGHDDPTMIRVLEEYITSDALANQFDPDNPFKATDIPLDDSTVLSLFHETAALGVESSAITCKIGCMGIPEFGTDFVIEMVQDAKPKSMSDLIRISGLSHGQSVWLDNAKDLIQEGTATLSTCICTRDDIMTYLINRGLDSALSFNIMENVRRGRGLTLEWEKAMLAKGVPQWYLDSCNKIKYMFPKAHAAAYVMMAYRIAYCKIHYPLAYYGAYFGTRAKAFSYELMCQGKEKLHYYLNEYVSASKRGDEDFTTKDEDTLKDLRIAQEMYARGFEFMPIDIYRAKAERIQIIDGKLMPGFISIDGLGEKAAEQMEEGAKKGQYLSIEDFGQRTKANKTVVELMTSLGLLKNLPETNQLSLFDIV